MRAGAGSIGGCVDCGQPTDFHNAFIEYYDGQDYQDLAGNHDLPQRLAGAFTIRLAADSTADRVVCTTTDGRGTATKQFTQANLLAPGAIAVRSEFAAYRLRYLVIYGQP